ncbi:MAG: hypothetical protein M0D57_15215 [Sphingobacteriales bacterium JAD_PAG50586_3]|nr:MAG: hypothetical protein M0D57_15215 [Sphingobacteriales bacterium JAD_PAG50586_3]
MRRRKLNACFKNYDPDGHLKKHLDEIPFNATFSIPDGRVFIKGERVRKRFKCIEQDTKRLYMISPIMEVEIIDQ